MTELRGEPAHPHLWHNFGGSVPVAGRLSNPMEPNFGHSQGQTPHPARPRSNHAPMDHSMYGFGQYPQEEPETHEAVAQSGLPSNRSYPTLKRSFTQAEAPAYQEMVQDLRDDGSRLSGSQDQKLLAFRKSQDKATIVDQHGRIQHLELSAQLHGMFFLSEMPSNGNTEGTTLQPELTCYRRNLFQISGSLVTPRGPMSVVNDAGQTVPVTSMEVTISAIESVDGNSVRLIVIPWKTPPPNSPEVNQNPDQEPPPLPLIPFQEENAEAGGEYAVYPVGWRRLQFRIATANNGRRKELQQHFVLHLKVHGTLADDSKVVLTESITAPVVVRGRSPRNFQARKEIPLLGSSAGSRGQALVESGMGVVAASVGNKQQDEKARAAEAPLPRAAFTFSPPKPLSNQLETVRSNTYPSWNSAQPPASMSQLPTSSAGPYSSTTMAADPYHKTSLSASAAYTTEPQELPLPVSLPSNVNLPVEQTHAGVRQQYPFMQSTTGATQMPGYAAAVGGVDAGVNVPRYVDSGRPMKSPRNYAHQTVHSNSSMTGETSPDYRYGPSGPVPGASSGLPTPSYGVEAGTQQQSAQRDYYHPSTAWTSSAGESRSAMAYTAADGRPFAFSQDPKQSMPGPSSVKPEPGQGPSHHGEYSGASRGSFDAMNNYSWSGN